MSRQLNEEFTETQEKKTTTWGGTHVDIRNDPVDNLAVALVADGRSNKFARDECAALAIRIVGKPIFLSDGQIRYRCELGDVNRMDYRDGIVRPYTKMTFGFRSRSFKEGLNRHLDAVLKRQRNGQH